MAERLMAADCKSAALTCYGGSNPSLPTIFREARNGGQVLPADFFSKFTPAHVAQSVEHVLGKDGVSSSNLLVGSNMHQGNPMAGLPRTPSAPGGFTVAGVTQLVESQPSKLLVAGSNPVSRSNDVEKILP